MKRIKILLVLAVLLAVVCLVGCDNPFGDSSDTVDGKVTIVNMSNGDIIKQVEVYDATTNIRVYDWRVNIEPGDSRTFSSIAPGKYWIRIYDDYPYDTDSNQFTVNSGATVTLTYNGSSLR